MHDELPSLSLPPIRNLPKRIRKEAKRWSIFDPVRRSYVALTPEEWVRQSFLNFLTEYRGYQASMMAVERLVEVNGQPQRADIIVYGRNRAPHLLVECKAPTLALSHEVLSQAARYNAVIQARYLCVTNGIGIMTYEYSSGQPMFWGRDCPAHTQNHQA